jgi:hypothetical protein
VDSASLILAYSASALWRRSIDVDDVVVVDGDARDQRAVIARRTLISARHDIDCAAEKTICMLDSVV